METKTENAYSLNREVDKFIFSLYFNGALDIHDRKDLINDFLYDKGGSTKSRAITLIIERIDDLLNGLFDRSDNADKSDFSMTESHYPYISYSLHRFYSTVIKPANKFKCKHFVDVGCGVGLTLFLSYIFGNFETITGIEYQKETAFIAKNIVNRKPYFFREDKIPTDIPKIINGDAFEQTYENYDFIYMYSPMADRAMMFKLYNHIFKTIQTGTYVVDVYHGQLLSYMFEEKLIDAQNRNGATAGSIFQCVKVDDGISGPLFKVAN